VEQPHTAGSPQRPDEKYPARHRWESPGKAGLASQKLYPLSAANPAHRDELATVSQRFLETMPRCTVDQVDRIENGEQHEMFEMNRRTMALSLGAAYSEQTSVRMLFHGTRLDAMDQIVNGSNGFKPLLAGSSVGAIWGDGTYFARDAAYSDSYAAMLPSGQKQMLLVRVLVGRYCRGVKGTKMYPLLPGEKYKRYNTLVGWAPGQPQDPANPSIFVVDKGSMAYPAFLITYHY